MPPQTSDRKNKYKLLLININKYVTVYAVLFSVLLFEQEKNAGATQRFFFFMGHGLPTAFHTRLNSLLSRNSQRNFPLTSSVRTGPTCASSWATAGSTSRNWSGTEEKYNLL
jgi:hypothetical protein